MNFARLKEMLYRIDGRGYGAYKEIAGVYREGALTLCVDHVQGDPFASPSRVRVRIDGERAGFPAYLWENRERRVALEDVLGRALKRCLVEEERRRGSGKSGLIEIAVNGQAVLERSSVRLNREYIEARLLVGLPADGRTVLGRAAADMLLQAIPRAVEKALTFDPAREKELREAAFLAEDQEMVRKRLSQLGLVAWVANGSILPRESGVSDKPLTRGAIPFAAPAELTVEMKTTHHGTLVGMGIPEGVTLIVGGGYHGKSTLLKALQEGVYDHRKGDGREWCITRHDAVKIRAEDGRFVQAVDIRGFIDNLPLGQDTASFSTVNASGSTSMAAGIMEALEVGCRLLLIDEDTSATNFMIRDGRMQRLVSRESEPITPFVDQVRNLYEMFGVSTILVIGGAGDYFDVADTVIMMDQYRARDVSRMARDIVRDMPARRVCEGDRTALHVRPRRLLPGSIEAARRGRERAEARGQADILLGETALSLAGVEQIVDPGQTRAIAQSLRVLGKNVDSGKTVAELMDWLEGMLSADGLDVLSPFREPDGSLAMPRRFEVAAALNRLRTLKACQA